VNVSVLGPQRQTDTARATVAELVPEGLVATISAGWREREGDAAELDDVLGGRMTNLRLWQRWREVIDTDIDYAAAERRLRGRISEQQALYGLRLGYALDAVRAVERRPEATGVRPSALDDAFGAVQRLDSWHLQAVAALRLEFYAETGLGERPAVARHRAEVADLVADAAGWVVTGGHVGALLQVLHVFDIGRLLRPPIIAWSAGAMALSEYVILFNDHSAQDLPGPQAYAEGMGAIRGVLPFPHPARRLRLTDHDHLRRVARRFAPRRCLLLDPGVRVDLADGVPVGAPGRIIGDDGSVLELEAESSHG